MQQSLNPFFWTLTKDAALEAVGSDINGLTEQEAADRLKRDGLNTFQGNQQGTGIVLFLQQLKSPLTLLLIAAAFLSLILGDATDSYIIFAIIIISSMLGYWQEKGATDAVRQLIKMVKTTCIVLRREQKEITIDQVAQGDIILISAGSIIPADCLLLNCNELYVDEAAFTGETFPVQKNPGIAPENARIAERTNCLFMGSHIISGKGTALVIKTAKQTEFGKISASLRGKAPETDFEKGIRRFGYLLMEITLLLVFIIFVINVFLHKPVLDSFLFSLALAVGLTPQLLPAIISVNLATGARRMARKKVIVKKLSSIENFGSMTILCSDKTGTLTEGKVSLKDCLDADGNPSEKVKFYAWLNASLQQGFHNPIDKAICENTPRQENDFILQAEIPYDFIRKRLTVQVCNNKTNTVISKGSFQEILHICDRIQTADGKIYSIGTVIEKISALYQQESAKGLRVLGIAYKDITDGSNFTREQETAMIFMGIITLFDPPKKEIFETINNLERLGVSLKIITGDNQLVAASLVKQIGYTNPVLLTGDDLRKMSNNALLHHVQLTDVFAEVEPNQKERIIAMLKKAGHVVGFLGDGINDAAALHAADVGISVDTAVDVAKEAADIILIDRDLNVLSTGIKEGRYTFANTMKYVFMATSANFGNMFSMAGASVFLSFLPLLPKQILLTNLLTDLPEMTIATDLVDSDYIAKPRSWNISFIKKFMLVFGLLSSLFDYLTFYILLHLFKAGERTFQTGWFTESVISAALIVLVVRTRLSFFKSRPGKPLLVANVFIICLVLLLPITPLVSVLGFIKLPLVTYLSLLLVIVVYIVAAELTKKWFYKKIDG